jgi:hypothetical protein
VEKRDAEERQLAYLTAAVRLLTYESRCSASLVFRHGLPSTPIRRRSYFSLI